MNKAQKILKLFEWIEEKIEVGDKVRIDNPDFPEFNGKVGVVKKIDPGEETFYVVEIEGKEVDFSLTDLTKVMEEQMAPPGYDFERSEEYKGQTIDLYKRPDGFASYVKGSGWITGDTEQEVMDKAKKRIDNQIQARGY